MQQGIGMATRWMSGWGLKFFDYDNDGNMDLILSNGFPDDLVEELSHQVTYKEPLLLFQNTGKGFQECQRAERPCVFRSPFRRAGWRSATSITMARWTCSSVPMTALPFC